MKNIKRSIVYIGNFLLPDGNAACHRVISNSKLFRLSGYQSIIISNSSNSFEQSSIDAVEFYSIFDNKIKYFLKIKLFSFIQNKMKKNSTVILYNSPISLISIFLILRLFKKDLKIVLDLSEYYSSSGMPFFKMILKSIDTYIRMNILWYFADGLITTSQFLTKKYSKYNRCPIIELPTLFDAKDFDPPILTRDKTTRFIYCGNPFNLKRKVVKERLDIVIQCLAQNSEDDYLFDIYGINKEDYLKIYPEHYEIISKLESKIFFHGRVSNATYKKRLRYADFQVFFRDFNIVNRAGFPTKLSESISSGIPVITSEMDGVNNLIKYEYIFLAQKNHEAKLIVDCMKLSRDTKNLLKTRAYEDKIFHYGKYEDLSHNFLRKM